VDAGITYFDTAPNYGEGLSEINLGRAIRELDVRGQVQIGTKVGLLEADMADPGAALERVFAGSLRRLACERVELLFLHTRVRALADDNSLSLGAAETASTVFDQMVTDGRASHTGFTAHGDTSAVQSLLGSRRYQSVQAYFSAVNPSSGYAGKSGGMQDFDGLIDTAAAAGLGVINIQPLSAGALTGAYHANARDFVRERGPLFRAKGDRLADVARDFGLDNTYELAFRFALTKPGISCVLVGFSSLAQLDQTIGWTARGPLPAAAVERVLGLASDGGPEQAQPAV
jgi:aryl-alcohol dehydrogenase-like predicted oxidoreductase